VTTSANIKVVGAGDTIKQLNKIDPMLRKKFNADVKEIAAPAVAAASKAYKFVPLSGMARNWQQGGNKKFPFDIAKAARGVKVKIDTSRRATASILIIQNDAGAAIFETAGRATSNRLGNSLGSIQAGRTRLIGPAVHSQKTEITRQITQLVIKVQNDIQRLVK